MQAPLRLTDLDLTLVIPQTPSNGISRRHGHGFSIGHAKSDPSGTINLAKMTWTELGQPAYVQVFIAADGVLAVKPCAPKDEASRRLDSSHRIRAHELTAAFDIQKGERFFIEGQIDQGHALGQVGEDLLKRMIERQRRGKGMNE